MREARSKVQFNCRYQSIHCNLNVHSCINDVTTKNNDDDDENLPFLALTYSLTFLSCPNLHPSLSSPTPSSTSLAVSNIAERYSAPIRDHALVFYTFPPIYQHCISLPLTLAARSHPSTDFMDTKPLLPRNTYTQEHTRGPDSNKEI